VVQARLSVGLRRRFLQALELCARPVWPRSAPRSRVDRIVAGQDAQGRWPNRYPYSGKMVIDIDRPRPAEQMG